MDFWNGNGHKMKLVRAMWPLLCWI
uniref:Uncharacterized protein n=1 Tax=Arundo donax TaxID=35708 RepID=A0A0A9HC77_ARUDO